MQQIPIKYGIIAGLATVLYLYIFYLVDPALFLNPLVYWSSLIIPIVAMVKATRKVKDEQETKLEKIAAIRTSFLTWTIVMLIFHVFMFLMFKLDGNLVEVLREMVREAKGDKDAAEVTALTFGQAFFRMSFMLLPGFLFSYMVASFMKK